MKNENTRVRVKYLMISGAVFLAVGGVILMGSRYFSARGEPLTPRQILEKKDWTKDELADTLVRVEFQRKANNQAVPQEVYGHLGDQLGKLPEKERDEVMVKTIKGSIGKGLALMRTLDTETRKTVMADIMKDAAANRSAAEGLNKEEKSELKSKVKEVYSKVVDETLLNKATPDERAEFAPVVKEWVGMLEALQ